MTSRSFTRPILVAGVLFVFGCGGVDAVPDGGGGAGGAAAGASGRGGSTGGQGGGAGAAGSGGSAGAGGAAGGAGSGGAGGGGVAGSAAGAGGSAGGGGRGGQGGTAGGAGSGGSGGQGGTAGGAGTGGTVGGGGAAGAGARGGAGGTAGSAGAGGAGGATGGAGGGGQGGTAGTGTAGAGGRGGSGGTGGAGGTGGSSGAGGSGGAIAAPTITSTNLAVVAHGLDLTINGSGFTTATGLTIGGVGISPFTIVSNTQIRVRVLDTTPTGAQSIVVTNPGGSSLPFGVTIIHLVINELDPDTASTDIAEFVEVSAGVASVSLAEYSLVFWNGANEMAYYALDLAGSTNSVGLFVVGNAAVVSTPTFPDNTLQNGADAVAIYAANASSFPTGSLLTSTRLIDAVVYGSNDADDNELLDGLFGFSDSTGRMQANEAANGMAPMQSIQRCGTLRLRGDRFALGTPSPGVANTVAPCN